MPLDEIARPLDVESLGELIDLAGGSRFVLIGESTHGTSDFYALRAELTRRLIEDEGFGAVAVEADWPDAYRVNCYVRGAGDDRDPESALRGFMRFPQWMWRNTEVERFVGWLKDHNRSAQPKVGFYGLDLYSLYTSIDSVLAYLDKVDAEAAGRARERYACLQRFEEDSQAYGYASSAGLVETCEKGVVEQLLELRFKAGEYVTRDGQVAEDEQFFAEQNARLVKNAEEYYRAMFRGSVLSWNLRDTHMGETLEVVARHLGDNTGTAKIVVWAHNSHVGDARATGMGRAGELNLGQLVRERHPDDSFLIGFTTYSGTVTAASSWGGEAELKQVRPALEGSFEHLFHEWRPDDFWIPLKTRATSELDRGRLERAIGVLYLPETERSSHYFDAVLSDQFDAVIHVDRTAALRPLDPTPRWRT
jgi:erythromycin esterase-like protein